MKIPMTKKLIIFTIIAIMFISGTVVLIVMDMRKAQREQLMKIQEEYLRRIISSQAMKESAEQQKPITLDEAKKSLPDVEKVDYQPE